MAGHVLAAYQVHAVSRAGDEADVGGGVQGRELVGLDGRVEELDGNVVDFAYSRVRVCRT